MCSLHLTHPSVHTWSSVQPTVQHPGSSRGLPARAGIQTHNLGSGFKPNALSIRPTTARYTSLQFTILLVLLYNIISLFWCIWQIVKN